MCVGFSICFVKTVTHTGRYVLALGLKSKSFDLFFLRFFVSYHLLIFCKHNSNDPFIFYNTLCWRLILKNYNWSIKELAEK